MDAGYYQRKERICLYDVGLSYTAQVNADRRGCGGVLRPCAACGRPL